MTEDQINDQMASVVADLFLREIQEYDNVLQRLPSKFKFKQWELELKKSGMFETFSHQDAKDVLDIFVESGTVTRLGKSAYRFHKENYI